MNIADKSFFCCLSCRRDVELKVFETERNNADNIKEGVFFCPACGTFYPISRGIPFFLDKSYYGEFKIEGFAKKWLEEFDFAGYKLPAGDDPNRENLKQASFFNDESHSYDDSVCNSVFWKANDWNTIRKWVDELPDDSVVLDLGCGSGRCTIPLAQKIKRVIGIDISFGLLQDAVLKSNASGVGNITYILADAENLPLKKETFSAVISFGCLHHVDDPERVILNVAKILKAKGLFCALENNASPLRPAFDLLMKLYKLWDEEAGRNPVFKRRLLEDMLKNSGMRPEICTSAFLPPHLFNMMGFETAKEALRITDEIFRHVPGIGDFGGQLVVRATKD